MSEDFRWKPVEKDPGETRSVELNLFALSAIFWQPNEEYSNGDLVWPVIADADGNASGIGYCFEATQVGVGRSGSVQPRFANADRTGPSVAVDTAITKLDGSVQWTCRPPTLGGFHPVVLSDPGYVVPDALVIASIVVSESMKLLVDYEGGTLDEDHEAEFHFIIAGRLRIGRQIVQVRKK